jgi:hypothetical protein
LHHVAVGRVCRSASSSGRLSPPWWEASSFPPDQTVAASRTCGRTGRQSFPDWRLSGLLLATLVGGGFTAAGTWEWRRGRHARELSLDAGLGLACFELAELAWMGFRPLEAVYALVGVTVCVLAARPEA